MSERKVLNKYYPPDFDPSKLPRVKREKNRQFTIRLMAPFNMRCKTCGEYIYRGKKFNARKEDVIGKMYLGIQIYRFYIKCTKCLAEITFLTDPENQDYEMEYGAVRNFECIRLAEKQAEAEAKQAKEEEENNPMKILENRTRDSRREMAVLETLEDLKEMNAAHLTVDPNILLQEEEKLRKAIEEQEREEDEAEIRRIFGKKVNNEKNQVYDIIVEDEEISDNDEEEQDIKDESIIKKLKTTIESNDKKSQVNINSYEEKNNEIPTTSVLFPKSSILSKEPVLIPPVVGQLNKSNVASFIKKKPVVIKSEPADANENGKEDNSTKSTEKVVVKIEETEPKMSNSQVNPLTSLCAYDDSDEYSDDN
jgi:hypothetical protein